MVGRRLVLGTAFLTWLLGLVQERLRTGRERDARWDADLRQLYAAYLVQGQLLCNQLVEYVDGHINLPAIRELSQLHEEIRLIAPERVLKPADEFQEELTRLWSYAARKKALPNDLFAGYIVTKDTFLTSARKSLVRR